MRRRLLFLGALVALFLPLQAEVTESNALQIVKEGPVHEAYISQEFGQLILSVVPQEPPPALTEVPPQQADPQTLWISGYWSWSPKLNGFLWVSGVWRNPPPNQSWIAGYWKHYSQGWVWVPGFWSHVKEENLFYLSLLPPDAIDELAPNPPPPAQEYFWVPGYWKYKEKEGAFAWVGGRWELLNGEWIYTPSRYIWNEKGYLFIPGFWDWPLEKRGVVYPSVAVALQTLSASVYEPQEGLEPLFVLEQLFPSWPNYPCLFQYHYYYHHDLWAAWGAAPPWWNWSTWWCLAWVDQWALWWWWSHPGYPSPSWMTPELAAMIVPPLPFVVHYLAERAPPANVTPNGVVGNQALLPAIQQVTGKQPVFLPTDIQQVQKNAAPTQQKGRPLQPTGSAKPSKVPQKPFFGPPKATFKLPPERVMIPTVPVAAVAPYQTPRQGFTITYPYPQKPMQQEHHDEFMLHPQPQRNPHEPKVYPLPGDQSTGPG